MKKLEWIIARRRELAARYTAALADHPWLRPPHVPDYAEPNFQSYAVQLTDAASITRDELMQRLLDAGIATRRGIMLAHEEPAYASECDTCELPKCMIASARSLLIPLYPQMTQGEQNHGLSKEDVEQVLCNPTKTGVSRSSGRAMAFGYTHWGAYIGVVYEEVDENSVYPVTAFELEED